MNQTKTGYSFGTFLMMTFATFETPKISIGGGGLVDIRVGVVRGGT